MGILKKINACFESELETLLGDLLIREREACGISHFGETVSPFISSGGKRLRPLLFLLMYQGLGGRLGKKVYRMAICLEILHTCAIVHDDIIDKTPTRRGLPTLNRMYASLFNKHANRSTIGSDFAIVAGDILFSLSIHLLDGIKMDEGKKRSAISLILETALNTSRGQYLEMVLSMDHHPMNIETIFKVYELKTALYTFCCPLQLAGIMKGVTPAALATLRELGLLLGKAFQIHDDLADFWSASARDAFQRISLPWWLFIEKTGKEGRMLLQNKASGSLTPENSKALREAFDERQIESLCKIEMNAFLDRARLLMDQIPLKENHRAAFVALMNRIFQ